MKGAFALYDTENGHIDLYSMPVIGSEIDGRGISETILDIKKYSFSKGSPIMWYLEKPQSMPGNAGQAMLRYGWGIGIIEGILISFKEPYHFVHPSTWTKEMHGGMPKDLSTKNKSAIVAQRIFPLLSLKRTKKCKKSDEGFVDAILIAEYGARCESGRIAKKLS